MTTAWCVAAGVATATASTSGSASTASSEPVGRDRRVLAEHPAGPVDVEVAQVPQAHRGGRRDVADQVRPPVTRADHCDADRLTCHDSPSRDAGSETFHDVTAATSATARTVVATPSVTSSGDHGHQHADQHRRAEAGERLRGLHHRHPRRARRLRDESPPPRRAARRRSRRRTGRAGRARGRRAQPGSRSGHHAYAPASSTCPATNARPARGGRRGGPRARRRPGRPRPCRSGAAAATRAGCRSTSGGAGTRTRPTASRTPRTAATTAAARSRGPRTSASMARRTAADDPADRGRGGVRTNPASTIRPSSAKQKLTTKIGCGPVPTYTSSRNVISGPSSAPAVSMVRCTPNAAPSRSAGTASGDHGVPRRGPQALAGAVRGEHRADPEPARPTPSMPSRDTADSP